MTPNSLSDPALILSVTPNIQLLSKEGLTFRNNGPLSGESTGYSGFSHQDQQSAMWVWDEFSLLLIRISLGIIGWWIKRDSWTLIQRHPYVLSILQICDGDTRCTHLSLDGNTLVMGSDDGFVMHYGTSTGKCLQQNLQPKKPHHPSPVCIYWRIFTKWTILHVPGSKYHSTCYISTSITLIHRD